MEHHESAAIADIGVAQTRLAVGKLGWLFREQLTQDYGIDAQIEIVSGTQVTGRLLAVQIKSGNSFFDHPTPDGWWYYPDAAHVEYWKRHALPVLVVLYEPTSELCHWQLIRESTLVKTRGKGHKVKVPTAHTLDQSAAVPLREAAGGDPYDLRLRQLRLALPWMRLLAEGKRLVVDIEEWVNKTSGRGSISLGIDEEDGRAPRHLADWGVALGLASYAEVLPQLFAWADVQVHEETYAEAEGTEWRGVDVIETREDWIQSRGSSGLRPYANRAGEVDDWRLELTLGDLGKAFMLVDDFASRDIRLLTR